LIWLNRKSVRSDLLCEMATTTQQVRDEWLALRCQHGDPTAFSELVAEMERPLLYFVAKLIGDQDAALDVLQEVWLNAFRKIALLTEPRQIRPWLYQLARGLAIDRVRKERADNRREREHATNPSVWTDEATFGAEDANAIHRALDTLEVKHREVLVLHFLEDLSVVEVAAIVNCPEGTVKSRLYHAKRALKAALGG
jgi:RNA polymerase sigma-70 factor (ECF subfamily)